MMKIKDFESTVWNVEKIRIVVRAKENEEVGDYDYGKAASKEFTLQKLLDGRINNLIVDKEVEVINGNGETVHGQTKLKTIRESYS